VYPGGQRFRARARLYLAEKVPTMLVWGDHDPIIPAKHGIAAHKQIPHSRLELIDDAGHFPYRTNPRKFAATLRDFIETTEPAEADWAELRELLRTGG
jgi:pimeloyl-ACP methyl ester carboxylesterase